MSHVQFQIAVTALLLAFFFPALITDEGNFSHVESILLTAFESKALVNTEQVYTVL